MISLFLKEIVYEYTGINFVELVIAAMIAFFSFVVQITLSLWLVERKAISYGVLQLNDTFFRFVLSVFFVVIMLFSWQGRIYGMLIGSAISALISIIVLLRKKQLNLSVDKEHMVDALKFGLPLIPHQLGLWGRNGAIIIVLATFASIQDVGFFELASKLSLIIIVSATAFNKAWVGFLYSNLNKDVNKNKIVKLTYLFFAMYLIGATILTYIFPLIIEFIGENKYNGAIKFIPYLLFGAAFHGMYLMVVNYIFYTKKTKYLSFITISVSILQVTLTYILIKLNGVVGAAQAALVAYFVNFLLVWFYSNKAYKMPWFFKH